MFRRKISFAFCCEMVYEIFVKWLIYFYERSLQKILTFKSKQEKLFNFQLLLAFSFYSIIVKIAVHSFVYDMNSFLNSTKPNLQSQCMNMKLAVYLHLGLLLLSLIILLFWKIDRFPLLYCILFEMNRLSPQLLNICMLLHRHNRN